MAKPNVQANFKKMKTLLGYLANGLPKVKVGIIGGKAQVKRAAGKGEFLTNAQIGFIQEFGRLQGTPKIPARSFLITPLRLYLDEFVKANKKITKEAFEKAVRSGNADKFAKRIGLIAEQVIQVGFETQGFGNWAPNAPATVARKGSDSPLIDTGELRRSISSEVIK